jgi:hypothetical protein
LTQNLILQTKKRPHNVKSVKTLGFYYKLRVDELARESQQIDDRFAAFDTDR